MMGQVTCKLEQVLDCMLGQVPCKLELGMDCMLGMERVCMLEQVMDCMQQLLMDKVGVLLPDRMVSFCSPAHMLVCCSRELQRHCKKVPLSSIHKLAEWLLLVCMLV
jgi:hypothetical protein